MYLIRRFGLGPIGAAVLEVYGEAGRFARLRARIQPHDGRHLVGSGPRDGLGWNSTGAGGARLARAPHVPMGADWMGGLCWPWRPGPAAFMADGELRLTEAQTPFCPMFRCSPPGAGGGAAPASASAPTPAPWRAESRELHRQRLLAALP